MHPNALPPPCELFFAMQLAWGMEGGMQRISKFNNTKYSSPLCKELTGTQNPLNQQNKCQKTYPPPVQGGLT